MAMAVVCAVLSGIFARVGRSGAAGSLSCTDPWLSLAFGYGCGVSRSCAAALRGGIVGANLWGVLRGGIAGARAEANLWGVSRSAATPI